MASTTLSPAIGFHPSSVTTINATVDDSLNCILCLAFNLPPAIFVDTHELTLRDDIAYFQYEGSRDLEKPVHALPDTNNTLLITAKHPNATEVVVPLHARYGPPSNSSSSLFLSVDIPWPYVSLVCSPTHGDSPTTTGIPYVGPPPYFNTVRIPLASTPDLPLVQLGTSSTILICFLWVAIASWRAYSRQPRSVRSMHNNEEKQKKET